VEETNQRQPVNVSASASQPLAQLSVRPGERLLFRHSRRNSLFIAGILSIALVLAGDVLMRSTAPAADPSNPSPEAGLALIGSFLVAVGSLPVGVVAWVNDDLRIGRKQRRRPATDDHRW
jgi:hypothetical protein